MCASEWTSDEVILSVGRCLACILIYILFDCSSKFMNDKWWKEKVKIIYLKHLTLNITLLLIQNCN